MKTLDQVKPMRNELSETSHTPGPWQVHHNIGRKGEVGIIADEAPCVVAIVSGREHWPAKAKSNAALIASAPELLAALESMLELWVEIHGGTTIEHAFNSPMKAAQAIAKAKGEIYTPVF